MIYYMAKAVALGNGETVPDETISIVKDLPAFNSLNEAEWYYTRAGEGLAEVLGAALPGGTMHQLLIALLKRKQDVFRGRE